MIDIFTPDESHHLIMVINDDTQQILGVFDLESDDSIDGLLPDGWQLENTRYDNIGTVVTRYRK